MAEEQKTEAGDTARSQSPLNDVEVQLDAQKARQVTGIKVSLAWHSVMLRLTTDFTL